MITVHIAVPDWSGMSSQVERGTAREMVHTIAFRAGVLERILQEPVLGSLEIRADELAHVRLLQRQIDDLRRYLNLPSAEPERKKGVWTGDCCSCCGVSKYNYIKMVDDECGPFGTWNFCPHCGADMRGEDGKA